MAIKKCICIKVYRCVSCNSSSDNIPAEVSVEGKLSVRGFEGCETSGSQAVLCGS